MNIIQGGENSILMLSDILTNFFYSKQKIKEPFELSYSIKKRKQISPSLVYTGVRN